MVFPPLLRRLSFWTPRFRICLHSLFLSPRKFSSLESSNPPSPDSKPSSLSARMSFIFDQIDAIERERSLKDQALQRIRTWRESKRPDPDRTQNPDLALTKPTSVEPQVEEKKESTGGLLSKEVELVHPWPEWIELMERMVQQNYFDHRRKDEDKMIGDLGFNLAEVVEEEGFDFTRDWKTVQTAVLNFGRDRFDILRSLSRQDLQVLVGYGCPSEDKKVVFSAKLLRKHVHLNEGDVCSSCSLRSSCERAFLLTNKEDEARTIDVMRVLLTHGFSAVDGSVANKSLMKIKSVKTVVRKLLHEVVKLSAVPIDPNLPPPVIKRPPPKVKQPPPPPKKRVGRDDIEMKKGDWLCPKCDFMNFAKNTVCLQCDAKRPKRQLLPGEWECPQCNFLNYRRNVVCFHCEHKRPPDEYQENQLLERQRRPSKIMDDISGRREVSNAWNFDFDDNESDGADVAAFEYADSQKLDEDFPLDKQAGREFSRTYEDGSHGNSKPQRVHEREYSRPAAPRLGFNDFDEEDDIDSYEMEPQNETQRTRIDFSDLEIHSASDTDGDDDSLYTSRQTSSSARDKPSKRMPRRARVPGSEDSVFDFDSDEDLPVHPNWKSSHVANPKQSRKRAAVSFSSDDDRELCSGTDDDMDHDFKSGRKSWTSRVSRRHTGKREISSDDEGSHSDLESSNGAHSARDGLRGKKGRSNCRGKTSWDRNGLSDRRNKNFEMPSQGSGGHVRGIRNGKYDRYDADTRGRNVKDLRSHTQDPFKYNKQDGRYNTSGNRSDSYLDNERQRRPRINVR